MKFIKQFHKKYFNFFVFRYVFLSNRYLLFYDQPLAKSKALNTLQQAGIGYRRVNKIHYLENLNFLNGNYILVYFNDLKKLPIVTEILRDYSLFIMLYNYFFINNVYFKNLIWYYKYYNSNYNILLMYLEILATKLIKSIYFLKLKITTVINSLSTIYD